MIEQRKTTISTPGRRLGQATGVVLLGIVTVVYLMSLRVGMWPPSHPWSGLTLVPLAFLHLAPLRVAGGRAVVLNVARALSVVGALLWLASALTQVPR